VARAPVNWWGENTADCLDDHDLCFRTLHIPQGDTATFWYEFKNIGGRTWAWTNPIASDTEARKREWRVFLGAAVAAGNEHRDSYFEASDWIDYADADDWRITVADTSKVAPDENGTFTFGLRATQAQGYSATEHFNLNAENLRWFKLMLKPDPDASGWEIDSIPLPITIMAPPPP
jgi:3',5'-cyclic AMP phosphodiesterase CpdA